MRKRVLAGTGALFAGSTLFLVTSGYHFRRRVAAEVDALLAQAGTLPGGSFDHATLAGLPDPVQRYFRRVLSEGQPLIATARHRHVAQLRLSPDRGWLGLTAEEYYTVGNPGFIWWARLCVGPLVLVNGRDEYVRGRGNMLIEVASAVPVVDAVGEEMDVSSLARFLSELPLLPTALLPGPSLEWHPRDATSATAVIADRGHAVSMDFFFDDRGEIVRTVTNDRYMTVPGGYEKVPWLNYYRDYRELNPGVRVPTAGEAEWLLPTGPFPYARLKLAELQYNTPAMY